jgi:Tol biopolymer transport system component
MAASFPRGIEKASMMAISLASTTRLGRSWHALIVAMAVASEVFAAQSAGHERAPYSAAGPRGTPQVFAPHVISTTNGLAFTPDGRTAFVSREVEARDDRGRRRSRIFQHRFENGVWSSPRAVVFSDQYTDYQPVLSPDGERLYFTSTRPLPGTATELRQNIWAVARHRDNEWGSPQLVEELATPGWDGYAVPVRSGRLYFVSDRAGGLGSVDIWSAEPASQGRFTEPAPVLAVNSSRSDSDLWVDPDERYMVFCRAEPPGADAPADARDSIDLWIAFRVDGVWRSPRKLDVINSPEWELSPTVSPDGRYLFFARRSVIYQVELFALLSLDERRWLELK